MYKGLLIDLGNTIIYNIDFDFNQGLINLYSHIVNPKLSLDQFLLFTKQFTKDTYDNREKLEVSFKNVLNYLKIYFHLTFDSEDDELELAFASHCEKVALVPDIEEVLKYFKKQKAKIVILSNSTFSARTLEAQIAPLNLTPYIDTLLSSSDCVYRKPHPSFFELGVKCLGLDKSEILYVGNDYKYDIIGANNVGLSCCWINENNEDNYEHITCLEIQNYRQLINYLKNRE